MKVSGSILLAAGLAIAAPGTHAQTRDPYWVCMDPAGNKVTRDQPCREGERQVLTNDSTVPKKRAAKARGAPEPAAGPVTLETTLPNPLARAADAAKRKDFKALMPLALLSIFAIAALALLRRRFAKSAAAGQTWEAPKHYPASPAGAGGAALAGGRGWSVNLIRDLDAKRFEEVVTGYWQAKGHRVQVNRTAANGDDVLLYEPTAGKPHSVAHCAALRDEQVSSSLVRQLWGATQAHRAGSGLLYVLSALTPDAQAFLKKHKNLRVVTPDGLLAQVWTLSREQQGLLLEKVRPS